MATGAMASTSRKEFAKWAPIFAHKPGAPRQWNHGNRGLSNHIQPRGSKRGLLYRGNSLPTPQPQQFVPHYALASAKRDGYLELEPEPLRAVYTHGPREAIAKLAHGLEVALNQPGVHFVKDPATGDFNFPPYVGRLHQPSEVDYDRMPPFITSSKDKVRLSLHPFTTQTFAGLFVGAIQRHFSLAPALFFLSLPIAATYHSFREFLHSNSCYDPLHPYFRLRTCTSKRGAQGQYLKARRRPCLVRYRSCTTCMRVLDQ